jgi:hypothetical protein
MTNHKSSYEIAQETKDKLKTIKAGNTKGMYCISYETPDTTIYCRTAARRKIHEQELKAKKIPYKLFRS